MDSNNQKYVSKCIYPCLQDTRLRRSKREEQMYDQIKKDKTFGEKKIYCCF